VKTRGLLIALGIIVVLLTSAVSGYEFSAKKEGTVVSEEKTAMADTLADVKQDSDKDPQDKIIAYYLHGTRRCKSCLAIEEYSHEAIEKGFPGKIDSGLIEMKVLNYDLEENKHFINDYHLYSSSLVIIRVVDGMEMEWKNLEKVWKLKGDKEEFVNYVRDEVSAMLEDKE